MRLLFAIDRAWPYLVLAGAMALVAYPVFS